MRWILDACTLISLVQSSLLEELLKLENNLVCIDASVFDEAVTQGKLMAYTDAEMVYQALQKHHIPIIPTDVSEKLYIFKDAGETSCYLLARDSGIIITADRRAYTKLRKEGATVVKIEQVFYRHYAIQSITKVEFLAIMQKLVDVNAISLKTFFFQKSLVEGE